MIAVFGIIVWLQLVELRAAEARLSTAHHAQYGGHRHLASRRRVRAAQGLAIRS
jgi:hypothetical protein